MNQTKLLQKKVLFLFTERVTDYENYFIRSTNPQLVSLAPQMQQLIQMVLSGNADAKIKKYFQDVWQGRVQNILATFDTNANLVTCKHK